MQKIAAVLRSDGTEGAVLLGFTSVSPDEIDFQEPVFIYDDGLPVPYFISSLVRRGQMKAICRLTGLRSLEDSEELVGREVWSDSLAEDEDDPAALEGWTVLSETGATVGVVTGYEDIPGNLCLYVRTSGGSEVLLPFHEDLLISADPTTETLILRIPEGLL